MKKLYELSKKIGLSENMINAAEPYFKNATKYALKYSSDNIFLDDLKKEDNAVQKLLALSLELALRAERLYKENNIQNDIYLNTMSDILIWCENCFENCGEYGIDNIDWLLRHFNLKLFRLGRLQFEPVINQEDFILNSIIVKSGKAILNVHIPQGEKLDYGECLKSYKNAYEFFNRKYNIFVCDSWLINPKLKTILSPQSNIIKFQNNYTVISENANSRQCEERVFHDIKDNPAEYPENSVLQRSLKKALINGESFGMAFGGFLYEDFI